MNGEGGEVGCREFEGGEVGDAQLVEWDVESEEHRDGKREVGKLESVTLSMRNFERGKREVGKLGWGSLGWEIGGRENGYVKVGGGDGGREKARSGEV